MTPKRPGCTTSCLPRERPPYRAYILAALALPGAWQLGLLLVTVARRFLYPYDLEWMEGGMLAHVQRFASGHDIYTPPSVEFTPFPYTPLYPALVALLSKVTGITYQVGRAVSVASILGILGLMTAAVFREAPDRKDGKWLAMAAALAAMGIYAATYPWVEAWYDIVRSDSLFLALGLGGLVMVRRWGADPSPRLRGFWHPKMAIAGALVALSFFTKQTGILFVAAGGVALLVMNWRAVASYAGAAGVLGLGGTAIWNKLSHGWFWIYVFEYFDQHEVSHERFKTSLREMFWHFPAMTIVIAVALLAVVATLAIRRKLPAGGGGFLYWLGMFLVGVLIGAMGWAKQWAHFNVYTPGMVLGGIAAGAGVVALAGCLEEIRFAPLIVAALALAGLGWQEIHSRWQPDTWIPTAADRAAGDALIAHIRTLPGEVYVPFHPWYAVLAGKQPWVHRMSIMEIKYIPPPNTGRKAIKLARAHEIEGLTPSLRQKRFAAVILDDRAQLYELPGLTEGYSRAALPKGESPRVVTGAHTTPNQIWLPKTP